MGSSLKDALVKAGLRATQHENERQKRAKAEPVQKSVVHQERRNYCEVCDNVQPDVERYNHRNPLIDGQWICVACADKNMIDDRFRMTAQSDFSLRNQFRREYGATRKAHEFDKNAVAKPATDNRGPQGDRGDRRGHGHAERGNERADRGDRNSSDQRNDKNKRPPFRR